MRRSQGPSIVLLAGSVLLLALAFVASAVPGPATAAPGDLDPAFGVGGTVLTELAPGASVSALALQSDGKIVAAGAALANFPEDRGFALARYNADGSLDGTFGPGGIVKTAIPSGGVARAVVLQPDGKIVVAGEGALGMGDWSFALARYHSDGTLDDSFGTDGVVTTDLSPFGDDGALAVTTEPGGDIIAVGYAYLGEEHRFALGRFNPDGSLGAGTLTAFGPSSATRIFAAAFQVDGKVVVAGVANTNFAQYGSHGDFALARYDASDGSLDTSFGNNGRLTTDFNAGSHDVARAVAIDGDGKVIAAGSTGTFSNFALARYDVDGSLDTTFGAAGKTATDIGLLGHDEVRALALEPDGGVIAAGFAPGPFPNLNDFAVARYDAGGALDTAFGTGGIVLTNFTGGDDAAAAAALQPDGKILVGGPAFVSPTDTSSRFALARYLDSAHLPTPTPAASPTPIPTCPADLNGDGTVTGQDVAIVARNLLRQDPIADVNGDGKVSLVDLSMVVKAMHQRAC